MSPLVDRLPADPRRRAVAAGGAVVVLLAVVYLGTAAWAGTRTARGTTVAGVDVGGLDRTTARQRLDRALGPKADAPLPVQVGEAEAQVVPSQAGLGIDTTATADRLVGFSLSPARLWDHLHGAGPADLVTTTDQSALERSVAALADDLDQEGADGGITFSADGAALSSSVEGRTVDRAAAARTLADRWYRDAHVRLPATVREPEVAADVLQRAFDEFALPATSAPITVRVGGRRVTVPVARLAPTLSAEPDGKGGITPAVDGTALAKVVRAIDPDVETAPRDATIAVVGGKPVTREGRPGRRLDPGTLAAAVLPALTSSGRTARVEPALVQPEVTTKALKDLGIVERVSTFTTAFPFNPPRTSNIRLAASVLDGTVVKPGQTFSLNAALGQRTKEKGYQQAPVINGGRLTRDYGGGISQVSTTLFNAVFFAGLDSVQHKAHSFYISRYPEGREATVSWPDVDQKFRNDSGHGILIKTAVSESDVTVSFYGTKVWDVEALKSPRTNVKQPRTIHDTDGDCVEQSPSTGFDVTVTRVFKRDGRQVRTEKFFTRYIPEDHVTCG
ncbi:VanW family protein [Angustibacter peucedani]